MECQEEEAGWVAVFWRMQVDSSNELMGKLEKHTAGRKLYYLK